MSVASALWGALHAEGGILEKVSALAGAIFIIIWGGAPYIAYWFASKKMRSLGADIVAGVLILSLNVYAHGIVFFFPTGSSTDALLLLFVPIYLTFIILPLGLAGGWLIGWAAGKVFGTKMPIK